MTKKPKGAKYHHLAAQGNVIYYNRRVGNRRIQFSTRTRDWEQACAVRDLFEQRKGIGLGHVVSTEAPAFRELAERYLAEGMGHLAASTREDREGLLREDGALVVYFGNRRVDELGRRDLVAWWASEIEGAGKSPKTGKNRLDAVAAVLNYAVDLEMIETNPADAFRAMLRRRNRTQRGRADASRERIHPIEDLGAFLAASQGEGGDGHLLDLLQLDAGLRLGEALGIRWSDVWWGGSASDTTRSLRIEETRARGRHVGPTKSGRTRVVGLSKRLRSQLRERWMALGQPDEPDPIVSLDPANYRHRHFRRVCLAAEVGAHSPKDLRDSYASYLVSAGIPLAYVSAQLGHSDVGVTARHYARWVSADYQEPPRLERGDLPCDLLAKITTKLLRRLPHQKTKALGKSTFPRA